MYKVVVHRYGSKKVFTFQTKKAAFDFGEWGSEEGEHFFEHVIDNDGNIMYDGKENVFGIEG